MEVIKKIVKTYGQKRKYQQLKFNKSDNLADGVVYVLTEAQYEEVNIYHEKLEELEQALANLKEENRLLKHDLESALTDNDRKLKDLTGKYEGQLKGYNNKIRLLENEKTKYEVLAEERQTQLEKTNTDLTDCICETAKLKNYQDQVSNLSQVVNKKDKLIQEQQDQLHQQEKSQLSQLYSIHNRLSSLTKWQLLLGKHKLIIEEIAPVEETKEIETIINK